MIRRHSQGIRPPERDDKASILALRLRQAIEKHKRARSEEKVE